MKNKEFVSVALGFLIKPVLTFEKVKSTTIKEGLRYGTILMLISAFLMSAARIMSMRLINGISFNSAFAQQYWVLLLTLPETFARVAVAGLSFYFLVWVFDKRGKLARILRISLYAHTPFYLLGWISMVIGIYLSQFGIQVIVGYIFQYILLLWSLILLGVGYRQYENASKAVTIAIIALLSLSPFIVKFFATLLETLLA